jgi:hypothetical protein
MFLLLLLRESIKNAFLYLLADQSSAARSQTCAADLVQGIRQQARQDWESAAKFAANFTG